MKLCFVNMSTLEFRQNRSTRPGGAYYVKLGRHNFKGVLAIIDNLGDSGTEIPENLIFKDLRDYLVDSKKNWCFGNRNEFPRDVFRFIRFWSTEPFGSPHWRFCLKVHQHEKFRNLNFKYLGNYLVEWKDFWYVGSRNEIPRDVFRFIRFWSMKPFGSPHQSSEVFEKIQGLIVF